MFIPKSPAEDVILMAGNSRGDKMSFPVPAGSLINISTAGLHYNRMHCKLYSKDVLKYKGKYYPARYWDDPYSFKPERFLKKDWPRDAFLPFSAGM
jgi:hypothetical protein